MKHFISPAAGFRRAVQLAAVLALGGVFAAVYGAQKPSSPLAIRHDDQPVPGGRYDPASYSDVVSRVSPSVVKITVETKARPVAMDDGQIPGMDNPLLRQFFGNHLPDMQQGPTSGLGSGVIISADGFVVTNNHVVDGADTVTVTLADGREFHAKVVGRDPQTDIAVVKIDARGLPAITFAESSRIKVGDRVLAVGNPFGIGETVTSGIVSATGRNVGLLHDVQGYENFIQTDAAINPGNSGGALVDIDGRLIGINTAILSRSGGFQGVGLAVPSDMVGNVAESLVRTGTVVRGYLGVGIQNITPALEDSFNLSSRDGALVASVVPDAPAARAGIQAGDVITRVDGQGVTDANTLALTMSEEAPGTPVHLDVIRDGKALRISATTGEKPGSPHQRDDAYGANDDHGVLQGVAVEDLNSDTRQQLNLPAHLKGALISRVDPDSAAARAGINSGDVILSINQRNVSSAQDAVDLSDKAAGRKTLIRLWSHGSTLFVVVDETEAGSEHASG